MKFTHYDYKNSYFLFPPLENGKYKKASCTVSQRSQLDLTHEYHTTYVNIFTDDKEIANFDLGVDFSPPEFTIKNRSIGRLFLNFVIQGKGRINGEPFGAGQFYYTLPGEVHTVESDAQEPFVSAWISIRGEYIQHIVDKLNEKSAEKLMKLNHRNDVMELTQTLLYRTNLGETSVSYLKLLIDIYLQYITPIDSNADVEAPEMFATEKIARLVRESKAYIRKNLKYVTVADMAAAQHYNAKYFSRVFTEAMGVKPSEYITDCKMEWAENALVHSTLSIEEITEAIGYEHRNSFAFSFKKKYGCTPSEYKKKIKNEKNTANMK